MGAKQALTVLESMKVPGWTGVYALGCIDHRVTLYSQQVRALNLAAALVARGDAHAEEPVVVIGAGAAGLTCAAGLLHLGVEVIVLERREKVLPLFDGGSSRWLHPRIYDWPSDGWDQGDAMLPLLTWKHDTVGRVRKQLIDGWHAARRGVTPLLNVEEVTSIGMSTDSPRTVVWRPGGEQPTRTLILAVGFGFEAEQPRYWEGDDLDADPLDGRERKWLVSGSGDGGLTDLLRLCIEGFRHDTMVKEFTVDPRIDEIRAEISKIENDPKKVGKPEILHKDYSKLDAPWVQIIMKERPRTKNDVWLATETSSYLGGGASPLNRFLVSQLRKAGKFEPIPSSIVKREREGDKIRVWFANTREDVFDRVVVRHGPTSALRKGCLHAIDQALAGEREARRTKPISTDLTRGPFWVEGTFGPETRGKTDASRPQRPASREPTPATGPAIGSFTGSLTVPEAYDVCLLHQNEDEAIVETIAFRLQSEHQLSPFLFKWNVKLASSWLPTVEDAICRSRTIAVFYGNSSLPHEWFEEMVDLATTVADNMGKRLIPVLLPGADISGINNEAIHLREAVDLTEHDAFARLVVGIRAPTPDKAMDISPNIEVEKYDVFLSYSPTDREAVSLIATRLLNEGGLRPFFDVWDLVPGELWRQVRDRALRESNTIAVFFGPNEGRFTHSEEQQIVLGAAYSTKRVIPVLLPGTRSHEIEDGFRLRTWVDFAGSDGFTRLIAGITGKTPERMMAPDIAAPADRYDVFLSYSVWDRDEVESIARRLRDELGLRPFFDEWHLIPGEAWRPARGRAISRSETAAVFIGQRGLSPNQSEEQHLLSIAKTRLRLIPVLLPGARVQDLDGSLRLRTAVNLNDNDGFIRLADGIRAQTRERGEDAVGTMSGVRVDLTKEDRLSQNAPIVKGFGSAYLTLGRWTLHELLGQGGYGRVYLGTSGEERAAIKICTNNDDEHARRRFRRGAEILRALYPHDNIIGIIDGPHESPGALWYAMNLVEGGKTLRTERLQFLKQPLTVRLLFYKEILAAIDFAHNDGDASVFHRDLTPENVLISHKVRPWQPIVCDFDLARDERVDDLTRSQALKGKEFYIPLEQRERWQGGDAYTWTRPEEVTRDIWSLGMLLQFILTGQESLRKMMREKQRKECLEDAPVPFQNLISEVIETMLADEPEQRFLTTRKILPLVDKLLEHLALSTHQTQLADGTQFGGIYYPSTAVRAVCNDLWLTDLTPLVRLSSLEVLDLSGTRVSDLSPLAELKSLRELDLEGTLVADLSPLQKLTSLERLNIMNTKTGSDQVQQLREGLPNLVIAESSRTAEAGSASPSNSGVRNDTANGVSLALRILHEAQRSVPAVRYFLAVSALAAAASIVGFFFGWDWRVAIWATSTTLVGAFLVVLFARASEIATDGYRRLILTLMWGCVILFLVSLGTLYAGVFWGKPIDLTEWLAKS